MFLIVYNIELSTLLYVIYYDLFFFFDIFHFVFFLVPTLTSLTLLQSQFVRSPQMQTLLLQILVIIHIYTSMKSSTAWLSVSLLFSLSIYLLPKYFQRLFPLPTFQKSLL